MGATTAERDLLRRAIILSLLVHLAAGANLPRLVSPHSTQPLVGVMQVISMPRIQDEAAPATGQLPSNPAPEVASMAHGRIAEGPAPVPASAEPTRPTPSPPALPVTHPIEETMALTTNQPVHALPTSPGLNPQSVSVPLSGSGGPANTGQDGDHVPLAPMDNRGAGGAENPGIPNRSTAGSVGGDDTPHPLAYGVNPPPAYPAAARRQGIQGDVLLEVLVDEDGQPVRVSLKQGSGHAGLDQAAIRAVQDWRFQPARRGGRPIVATAHVPVRYRLTE